MSAFTRCDVCAVERAGRRLKHRISMRVHAAPTVPVDQVKIVEKDVCSDKCLQKLAQDRIAERAERKAREEASEGADVTPTPLVVPPRQAASA